MATEFVIIRLRKENTMDAYVMHWQFEDCVLHLSHGVNRAGLFTDEEADKIILIEKQHQLDKIKVTVDL